MSKHRVPPKNQERFIRGLLIGNSWNEKVILDVLIAIFMVSSEHEIPHKIEDVRGPLDRSVQPVAESFLIHHDIRDAGGPRIQEKGVRNASSLLYKIGPTLQIVLVRPNKVGSIRSEVGDRGFRLHRRQKISHKRSVD